MSAFPPFNRFKQCRHGTLLYNMHDIYVGRSLDLYGKFSEGEAALFQQMLKPGMTVVEVGSNIGALTVVLAWLILSTTLTLVQALGVALVIAALVAASLGKRK